MHVANVSLVDINFIVLDLNEFFVLPNIDHYLTEMTILGLLPVAIFFYQRSTTAETGGLGLKIVSSNWKNRSI